jgi:hypothetical protein
MTFTDSNISEQTTLNATAKLSDKLASMVREHAHRTGGKPLGDALRPARWAIRV